MNIDGIKNIYFLGIGGIGMSALARYFYTRGVRVSGYDKTPSPLTRQLQEEGIDVHYEDDPVLVPDSVQLVIYTPAVPSSTSLFQHLSNQNIPIKKRAEVLGMISSGTPTIAVAGTHGKTTVSAMVAHILKTADIRCIAFLGGILTNYNSNYLGSSDPRWMVIEADEYDRSFLHLRPELAVITSMDADHLDVYKSESHLQESFSLFAKNIKPGGTLLLKKGLKEPEGFKEKLMHYHLSLPADFSASGIRVEDGMYVVNFEGKLNIENLPLGSAGRHNVENALAAAALARLAGAGKKDIARGLNSFMGVKRRFENCFKSSQIIYIDDYAHHPEELKATISAVKELYPDKKVTGIFQPHLFSRTRDLEKQFAESLALLDELILLEIYPARELPIKGVSSEALLEKIPLQNKKLVKREELLSELEKMHPEVLLTLGAGDIDRFQQPIVELLKKRHMS